MHSHCLPCQSLLCSLILTIQKPPTSRVATYLCFCELLISFNVTPQAYSCCCQWQDFLFSVSIAVYWVYTFFFVQSSANIPFVSMSLTTTNDATWTQKSRHFFWNLFLINLNTPRLGLLNHGRVLLLTFWGTCMLLPIISALIYTLTDCTEGFAFLHILAKTLCFVFTSGASTHTCRGTSREVSSLLLPCGSRI